jgi:hypothetical protein
MPTTAIGSTGITYPNGATNGGFINSSTAVASTSGTSIDFTSIPSWVRRITVMFQGVSTNGSSVKLVQLGTSSGVVTSGYLGASSSNAITSVTVSNFTDGFAINQNNDTNIIQGGIVISNLSSNNWVAYGVTSLSNGAASTQTSGSIALGGTLSRVRITTANGTDAFDAGLINILYE